MEEATDVAEDTPTSETSDTTNERSEESDAPVVEAKKTEDKVLQSHGDLDDDPDPDYEWPPLEVNWGDQES